MKHIVNNDGGYVRVNWEFVEGKMLELGLSPAAVKASGIGDRPWRRIRKGERIQRKTVLGLALALKLRSDELPQLYSFRHDQAGSSAETLCLAS